MAGLMAARQLYYMGLDVTVIEARVRGEKERRKFLSSKDYLTKFIMTSCLGPYWRSDPHV